MIVTVCDVVSTELSQEPANETDAATAKVPVSFSITVKVSPDLTNTGG